MTSRSLLTVPIQNVSMVEETEDCSLLAIKLSPQESRKGLEGSAPSRPITRHTSHNQTVFAEGQTMHEIDSPG